MVCDGLTGRLEVATKLIELLNLQDDIKINEVNSEYFASEYFADRPVCERLINKRLDDIELNIMRDWRVALNEYIKEYYNGYLN